SAGYLLTNRHVAEAWADDEDLEQLRKSGADVDPVFTILRAYFPPGGEPLALTVVEVSRDQDVALLRTLRRTIDAPVVLLGRRSAGAAPGQEVVLIGYPTGVHNLMFRVDQTTREEIANSVGDGASPVRLAAELARRNFVQPLVTLGTISDTTVAEIIHTAQSTGGGSGGPIISAGGRVMGIHYAFVTSPLEGDPFRTQRAVKISYAWDILPNDLARRLNAATRPTPGTPPSEVRR
ncbi:MAG: serine protease, partial [Gemmatimonadales bacterium]